MSELARVTELSARLAARATGTDALPATGRGALPSTGPEALPGASGGAPATPLPDAVPGTGERPWPALSDAALYGLPGRIVRTLEPHTEADPAAMLATLYAAAGAVIGRGPHVVAGAEQHGARVWPLVIGSTAAGRKGTSWAEVRRVLSLCDPEFVGGHVRSGLSSAEGLIFQVRDPSDAAASGDAEADAGVEDKRLFVVEPEFATVLAQGRREGNTLLPVLRQAWDGGVLSTLTVRPRTATDPHVVVAGHITPTELRAKLTQSERAGGTMNRFLPVLSRRSKRLPDGGSLPDDALTTLGADLGDVLRQAVEVGRMTRTPDAARYWHRLYERLTPDHLPEGVAQVISRAEAQVLRLSVVVALLDGASRIDLPHLMAAEALWDYVEASAWYVFGESTGNPDLDRLKAFVDAAGDDGTTRERVSVDCFGRHRSAKELDVLLSQLVESGDYEACKVPTGGRPATGYRRSKRSNP